MQAAHSKQKKRTKAYENLQKLGIDAVMVIGGNSSLAEEYDISVIGLPGTIDNDLYGTDSTIGCDTALNTIMESVDKIRGTATSHARIFFVEGRIFGPEQRHSCNHP